MAHQVINIGAQADDGTGDNLRTISQKVNANFDEVYANAGQIFASRADAESGEAWAVSQKIAVMHDGMVLNYARDENGTALQTADGAKWSPADAEVFPEHYGAVADWTWNSPGPFTDCGPAINAALTHHGEVRLRDRGYYTNQPIINQNKRLIGTTPQEWPGKGSWIVGSSDIPTYSPVLGMVRSASARGIGLRYATGVITGDEGEGERRAVGPVAGQPSWQRGGYFYDIVLDYCGTAIGNITGPDPLGGDKADFFSVEIDAIEVRRFSFASIDLFGAGTGNSWGSIYQGWPGSPYTPSYITRIRLNNAECFDNLNLEHSIIKKSALCVNDVRGLVVGSLHIEGVILGEDNAAFIEADGSQIHVNQSNIIHTGVLADISSAFLLGDHMSWSIASGLHSGYQRRPSGMLKIGALSLRGLANPDAGTWPGYPPERRGIATAPDFKVIRRKAGFSRGWLLDIDSYQYGSYTTDSNPNTAVYRDANKRQRSDLGKVFCRNFGWPSGSNVVANSGFSANDAPKTTTVTTPFENPVEFADRWFAGTNTGDGDLVLTQTFDGDVLNSGEYFLNVTATNGRHGSFWCEIRPAQRFASKEAILQFTARKAPGSAEPFTQISCSLANAGGSPASEYKQVVAGSSYLLGISEDWGDFEIPFAMISDELVSLWGAQPFFRLRFHTSEGTARSVDFDIKNVRLLF